MNAKSGFTFVELMIASAIVGILLAIAIPSYQSYTDQSHDAACASEVTAYLRYSVSNVVMGDRPSKPNISSCSTIPDLSNWSDVNDATDITSLSKSGSLIVCSYEKGCILS